MSILTYDEAGNVDRLELLPTRARVAFALLVASRLLPSYRRFHERTGRGDASALEGIADRLWLDLAGEPMSDDEVQAAAEQCLELVPSEEDGVDAETQPHAEDAAVALRARQDGDAHNAAWAAQRAYETLDHHAASLLGKKAFGPDAETKILSHPLVQAELARQNRDLVDLTRLDATGELEAQLPTLRDRAQKEADAFFAEQT